MHRLRKTAGLAAFLALAVAAVAAAGPVRVVDWPQFHGSPDHRGFNPAERGVGPGNVFNLSIDWIGDGAGGEGVVFQSSPAVVDGMAYLPSDNGVLNAFRANGCQQGACAPVWTGDLGQSIYTSPAVANGVVFIASASVEGELAAFDASGCGQSQCQPLWTAPLNDVMSSPVIAGGVVYAGSFSGGLYAFDASGCGQATCSPLWVGQMASVQTAPTVSNGVVYAGSSDSNLYAFDAAGCGQSTCAPLWRGRTGGGISGSTPAVSNGVVFVGSFWDGKLNAFTASGCGQAVCRPLWRGDAVESSSPRPPSRTGACSSGREMES